MPGEPHIVIDFENYSQDSLGALEAFRNSAETGELSAIRVLDIMQSAEDDTLEKTISSGSQRELFKAWRVIVRGQDNLILADFDEDTEGVIATNRRMMTIVDHYARMRSPVYKKTHDVGDETKRLRFEQLRLRWLLLFGRIGNAAIEGLMDED